MPVVGSVYLLHFDPGIPIGDTGKVARHYIGWTEGPVEERLRTHLSGRGSPLVKAVVARGGSVVVSHVWEGVDRYFERKLKKRQAAPRLCPLCPTDRNDSVAAESSTS